MAKNYTKEEIKELLKQNFDAESVVQCEEDYDDEYHILRRLPDNGFRDMVVEVVTMKSAINNESDFGTNEEWKDFITYLAERLAQNEEVIQIGAYTKLSPDKENDRNNLFWREF